MYIYIYIYIKILGRGVWQTHGVDRLLKNNGMNLKGGVFVAHGL